MLSVGQETAAAPQRTVSQTKTSPAATNSLPYASATNGHALPNNVAAQVQPETTSKTTPEAAEDTSILESTHAAPATYVSFITGLVVRGQDSARDAVTYAQTQAQALTDTARATITATTARTSILITETSTRATDTLAYCQQKTRETIEYAQTKSHETAVYAQTQTASAAESTKTRVGETYTYLYDTSAKALVYSQQQLVNTALYTQETLKPYVPTPIQNKLHELKVSAEMGSGVFAIVFWGVKQAEGVKEFGLKRVEAIGNGLQAFMRK